MKNVSNLLLALCLTLTLTQKASAQSLNTPTPPAPAPTATVDPKAINASGASVSAASTRYGFLDALDHNSSYGQGVFPEPFLVDDSDLETNEARLDWIRTGLGSSSTDIIHGEVEKGFGQVTVELEAPLELDRTSEGHMGNFGSIDVGARMPVFEFVGKKDFFDTTFGVGMEVGIPSGSPISKTTELVPKIFNDTRIGNFTMQSLLGYSCLLGANAYGGGQQTFEYGFVWGYTIDHDVLPIPGVMQFIPVFEIQDAKGTNMDHDNNVIADAGFRANLKPIGTFQPRLGISYEFPINPVAEQDLHWGVVTSLVFEY